MTTSTDDLEAMLASTAYPAFLPVVEPKPLFEFSVEFLNIDPEVFDLLCYGGPNPCIVLGED